MSAMLKGGAVWALDRGYGTERDLGFIEEEGAVAGARTETISAKARARQSSEMGTLGSGNHYLEIQQITDIYDAPAARAFGLNEGECVLTIHCGSRGLGHQVGTEFLREMAIAASGHGIRLPDRELACAPINSDLGQRYIGAMRAAINCALRAGAGDLLLMQDDLRLDYVDDRGESALACPRLPAPLHLLAGLLGLRVPWRVRFDALRLGLAIRFGHRPSGVTLAEYFRRHGQSRQTRRLLWDPLAIAILNETPERADASLFWNVYREAFLRSSRASRLVFLRRGLGVLHEDIAAYFQARGGRLRRRALVEAIELGEGRAPGEAPRVRGVRYLRRAATRDDIRRGRPAAPAFAEADAVVAAVPWHVLPGRHYSLSLWL